MTREQRIRRQLCVVSVLSLCVGFAVAQPAPGGHFRSASMAWRTVSGNTVEFELQTAWRRSFEGFYVNGLPAMGEIYAGDVVSIGGSASPRFDFGDGGFAYINVEVTDFSIADDWIFGVTALSHSYETPNRGYREDTDRYGDLHITQGSPWTARFSGCCRLSNLQNMAGEGWNMSVSLDTQQSSGFPAMRSLPTIAFPRTPDGSVSPLCKLLAPPSNAGVCTKIEFSTLPCADHQSAMGVADGFAVARTASTPTSLLLSAGGVARMPCSGGCPPAGVHVLAGALRDGRVAHVAVRGAGDGTCADGSGALVVSGGSPARAMAGTYTVANGRVASVLLSDGGAGYQTMPAVRAGACVSAALEAVGLEAEWSVLVLVQPRHTCAATGLPAANCDPALPGATYLAPPLPVIYPDSFPGIGSGWDAAALRVVPPAPGFDPADVLGGGEGGVQTSDGHAVAFAGREWAGRFSAELNWCQQSDGAVPPALRALPACLVPDARVSIGFSRLPAGAEVWAEQEDAITGLLLSFDNPFEAHRPGHRGAVARDQRELVGHPTAEQALQLGYHQLPVNLNAGAGGATVYLWVRRWAAGGGRPPEEQRPITHLNVSSSGEEEAALAGLGFERLEGNLNEQAAAPPAFLWFKRTAGPSPFSPARPAADGLAVGFAELAVVQASEAEGPGGGGGGWEAVGGDLNAGVSGAGLRLWGRRGQANGWAQHVRWRPCACAVGRHFICAAARSSALLPATGARAASEQRCLALDVLPASLPQFRAPAPSQRLHLVVGRELRTPVVVAVEDPEARVLLEVEEGEGGGAALPAGAALDREYEPEEGCEGSGACYWRARDLVWTAGVGQGGLQAQLCFAARPAEPSGCEPPGQAAAAQVCVTVEVERCVYAVQAGQGLQEVAALFSTDWLTLFALNPALSAPDRLLAPGLLLHIGHLYVVAAGDTASNIAHRFGTSVAGLLGLNADLGAAELLLAGQTLCLIPDDCNAHL